MKRHWDLWNDSAYADEVRENQQIPVLPISSAIAFISEKLIEILGGSSLLHVPSSPPSSPPASTASVISPDDKGAGEHDFKKKKIKRAVPAGKCPKTSKKQDVIRKRRRIAKVHSAQVKQSDDITNKETNVSSNNCLINEENIASHEQCKNMNHCSISPSLEQDEITGKQSEVIRKNELQSSISSTGSVVADKCENRNPTYYNRHYVKQWLQRSFQDSKEVIGDIPAVRTCVTDIPFGYATEIPVTGNEYKVLRRSNRKKPKGILGNDRK